MHGRVRRVRPAAPVEEVEEDVVEESLPEEEEDEDEQAEPGSDADKDRIENKYRDRAVTPLKAIRGFCVLCMGCQPKLVASCTATKCILYPYRFGKNPYQRRGPRD
jgi:hypothetical protein